MFTLVDRRYKINGRKLQYARENISYNSMNMSQFAFACGWTCGYQWKLENNRVETISESTKKVIESVLRG